jgi:hypothetical protein
MTKHAVTLTLAAFLASSAPMVLDAQRGGGAQMGAGNMGGARGGGGGARDGGGSGSRGGGGGRMGRGGGARGGGRGAGGGAGGGSGFQFQAGVNLPALPIPPSAGLSISRPIGTGITGVQTNPPPGFELTGRSPFAARRGTFTRLHRSGSYGSGIPLDYGFGVGGYDPSYRESTYDKLYRTTEPAEATTGSLFLDVTPTTALVFVDTALVGSVGDLQARGVTLSPGRHWLDLEAPGFEKKTIEITIRQGEPLRYRFDMSAARSTAVSIVPERRETMYAIPGCYGGNRPPVAANLPRGCDIAKVRVIRPQQR